MGLDHGGNGLSREIQRLLSQATSSNSYRGKPRCFQASRDRISQARPWSAPGSPPGWICLKYLSRETSRRDPDQMPEPSKLAPLKSEEQRLYSEPLQDVRASHPVFMAEPSHHSKEAQIILLVFMISFFQSLPRAHNHR